MGKCYSRSPGDDSSKRTKEHRRYRRFPGQLFRGVEDENCLSQKEGKYQKRGSEKTVVPKRSKRGSEKTLPVVAKQNKRGDEKQQGSRKSRKSQRKKSDEEIEIYPYENNVANGIGARDESRDGPPAAPLSARILKSDMSTGIPNLANMVKIVVASVHDDVIAERVTLEKRVYPELSRFCRQQGYDLHIIDLDLDDDQFKYQDWLEEISKAHQHSTAVGFMVLIGQNFGERSLPGKISVEDMGYLCETLPSNSREKLGTLYELRDVNRISCYVARETGDEQSVLMEEMKTNNDSKCLFHALLQVASLGQELTNEGSSAMMVERSAGNRKTLNNQDRESYKELEIVRTLYKRSKATMVPYEDFEQQDKEKQEKFYKSVLEMLKKKLQSAIAQPRVIQDENVKEIAQHVKKCQELLKDEQEHVLNIQTAITSYLKKNTKYPLVIHGTPGCGKSTVVAMAAHHVSTCSMPSGTSLVVRFLGTTRHASNLRFLLQSICFQLANVNGDQDVKLPKDLLSLVKLFHNFLHNASKSKRLWIILDSLDELPKTDLIWLPRELPDHVRIVLTCLTNGGRYKNLKVLVKDPDHFVDIDELDKPHAITHVTTWCRAHNMEPGNEIGTQILDAVHRCPNMLYFDLLLHHYHHKIPLTDTKPPGCPSSLKHAIEHFFITMETRHGKTLVGRIMGYLSASRYGLSERELQDVLSKDKMSGQKNSSTLHIRSFHLARILHDLSPCLAKVYFDGTLILTWKHIIIRYLAFDRYLSHRQEALNSTYHTLTNYYVNNLTSFPEDDTIATTRRVHDLPHYLCKIGDVQRLKNLALCNYKFLLAQLKTTCVDYVIECLTAKDCPLDHDVKTLLDTLKMSSDALNIDANQLAAQLIGRLSDLTSSDHLTRLLNEARSSSSNALIPNTGCLNPPGTKLLHTSLELYGPVDLTSDSTVGISAINSCIALWDVKTAKIIRQSTEERRVKKVLFCRNNRLFVVDTGLYLQVWETSTFKKIWRFEYEERVTDVCLAGDANDVLVGAFGSTVRAWNMRTGQQLSTLTDLEDHANKISGCKEYVACANSNAKQVRVYDIFAATFVTCVEAYEADSPDTVNCVLLTSYGDGQVLVNSRRSCDLRVFRLSSGEWLRTIGPDIINPRLTSDGRHILSTNTRNDIGIWSMEIGIKLTNVFRHPPTSIITDIVGNDLTKLVTLSDNKILRVWDLDKEDSVQLSLSQEKDDNCIRNVVFIKSKGAQRQAVSRSKVSGDICVWNVSNCTPVRVLKGTQADNVLVVDETRAVLRSMGKLALIDLEEGRLIKKLRVAFPKMGSRNRMERRASSLYKRRNLSLRLLQRSGVTSKASCAQFSDVAIVGVKYVVVLTSKRNVLNLISLNDGELVEKLDSGHKECVETILVSDNGKTLICSYEKSPAAAWNLETRRVVGWLRVDLVFPKLRTAAITRDGKYLVDALRINDCSHLVTWNIDIAEVQCKISLVAGTTVQAVATSSASGLIVASLNKHYVTKVMVYALRSGSPLCSLPCDKRHAINNIHLSVDGNRAMTFTTGERTLKLWKVNDGVQIGSFTTDHTISDCTLSDDGQHIVLAVYKASTIASLSFTNHKRPKEMSVDVSDPYSKPENYGAVFEFINILDWDDDTTNMDNTLAEKQ